MARSLRSFMIAFLFSIIAFAIAASYLVPFLNDLVLEMFNGNGVKDDPDAHAVITDEGKKTPEEETPDGEQKEQIVVDDLQGNTFTILFILQDDTGKYADALVMMKADKEHKRFIFSAIPAKLVVSVGGVTGSSGEPITLSSLYYTHGCEYLAKSVSAITGITVNYYYCVTPKNFVKTVDTLGKVPVTLKYDMKQKFDPASESYDVDLAEGDHLFTGSEALMYLKFSDYTNGDAGRRTVEVNFLKLMLDQYLTNENFEKASALYKPVVKLANTTLTQKEFDKNADLLFKFKTYTIEPTVVFPVSSKYDQDGIEYSTYDTQSVLDAYRKYK